MIKALAPTTHNPDRKDFVQDSLQSVLDELEKVRNEFTTLLDLDSDETNELNAVNELAVKRIKAQLEELIGTLDIMQLPIVAKLIEHLNIAVSRLAEKNEPVTLKQRQAIFESNIILQRFIEFLRSEKNEKYNLILAPSFFALSTSGLAPFLSEAELSGIDIEFIEDKTEQSDNAVINESVNAEQTLRRMRKMYQVGLIGLLRDSSVKEQFKLIERVVERCENLIVDPFHATVWRCLKELMHMMDSGKLVISAQRRHFFSRFDRLLRSLSKNQTPDFSQPPESLAVRELICLLMLADRMDIIESELSLYIRWKELGYTDRQVEAQRKVIESGLKDSIDAVSVTVNQIIIDIKHRLSMISESEICEASDVEFITENLEKIGSVLRFCGFTKVNIAIDSLIPEIKKWEVGEPDQEEMLRLADTILEIENLLMTYRINGTDGSLQFKDDRELSDGIIEQAQIELYKEIQANIGLAIRAISSYIESGYQKEHIANIPGCLKTAVGAFQMIDLNNVADLIKLCITFIDDECSSNKHSEGSELDALADSLVAIEYLLHELCSGRGMDTPMNQLIEENIASLS